MTGQHIDQYTVEQVKQQIYQMVTPHILTVDGMVRGKREKQQRTRQDLRGKQCAAELDLRVRGDCGKIVKDKRRIEGVPISNNSERQKHQQSCNRAAIAIVTWSRMLLTASLFHRATVSNSWSMAAACWLPGDASNTVLR